MNDSNTNKRWYVSYAKPCAEDAGKGALERKKISVSLPRIPEVGFRRHRIRGTVQALFPNHLFARLTIPDEYYTITWAKGVKTI